jgi:acyl carrier protein
MAIINFEERVLKIISQAVPVAFKKVKITPESNLARDLGIDSLSFVSLVFKFEEEFGVEVDPDEANIASLKTVKDVLRICKEIVERGGGT